MADSRSFSGAVDQVKTRAGRGSTADADVAAYMNATIRECNVLETFRRDLIENEITPTTDPFVWEHGLNIRLIRTVKYAEGIYPKNLPPGKIQDNQDEFYYGGPGYYVFKGVTVDTKFDIAYYTYLPRLVYYVIATQRPAVYNDTEEKWTYLSGGSYVDTLGSTTLDDAARLKVTNWLLENWFDLVCEGTLAKILKKNNDQRAPATFALYKSFQKDLLKGEPFDSLKR